MSQPVSTSTPPPTPNAMPGATPGATPAAENAPAGTTTPAATPAPAQTDPKDAPPATGTSSLTADEKSELDRLRAVRTEERIWEKRAKENFEKAQKFDAAEEAKKTDEQRKQEADVARDLEIVTLKQERDREKVARETGVPPELIGGTTEAEMRSAAEVALAYRGSGTPPAPTSSAAPASAVTSDGKVQGPTQITSRDELAKMSPQDRMKAWRDGQLTNLGAPPPPDRPNVKVNT